jgi:hypothetical protein
MNKPTHLFKLWMKHTNNKTTKQISLKFVQDPLTM